MTQEQSTPRPVSKNQKRLYFKLGFILLLILLLMIPNAFISGLIHERSSLRFQTQNEISNTWGGEFTVAGPVMIIPYQTTYTDQKTGVSSVFDHKLYLAPERTDIDATATTEERKKSIYSTTLFTASCDMSAVFQLPEEAAFGDNTKSVDWSAATVFIPVRDPSALQSAVYLEGASKKSKCTLASDKSLGDGIAGVVDVTDLETIAISTQLSVRGSRLIEFLPTAADNTVKVTSDWPDPGFVGSNSPVHDITSSGFSAEWTASEYSRAIPASWSDSDYRLSQGSQASFGVRLVQTVDHYQKNTRSVKYALLIISLSFLTFFFYEVLKGAQVHPLQYILVGLALSLFYLLLLSFSEHIGFNLAYGVAALCTVCLIGWYSKTMIGGRSALVLTGTLAGLYTYIFVLLQMENYALLAGAIGLFVILATVMALSRKMEWYSE